IYEVVEVLEFVGVEVVGSDPAIFFCGPGLALVSLNLSTRISQFGGIHATHCLQEQVPDLRIESFIGVHRLDRFPDRSEEQTSELQSRENLVCRLLLEKKNKSAY